MERSGFRTASLISGERRSALPFHSVEDCSLANRYIMRLCGCKIHNTLWISIAIFPPLALIMIFGLDCLQSSFSLKLRLVLISSSALANNDDSAQVSRAVTLQRKIRDCSQSIFGLISDVFYRSSIKSNKIMTLRRGFRLSVVLNFLLPGDCLTLSRITL